jgi:CheY-like chemotaxis protein
MQRLVLVVDDEQDVLDVLTGVLESFGYSAMGVTEGAKALEILKEKKFDLVITDLIMPEMGGLDFVKKMRRMEKKTPVIITAGIDINESKIDLRKYGVNDFILKPFIIGDVGQKIEKYLKNKPLTHYKNN